MGRLGQIKRPAQLSAWQNTFTTCDDCRKAAIVGVSSWRLASSWTGERVRSWLAYWRYLWTSGSSNTWRNTQSDYQHSTPAYEVACSFCLLAHMGMDLVAWVPMAF
jgi:hypothetical protein